MTRRETLTLAGTLLILIATLMLGAMLALFTVHFLADWPQMAQMAVPTEIALLGAIAFTVRRTGLRWRDALAMRRLTVALFPPLALVLIGSVTVFGEIYFVAQRLVPVPEAYEFFLRDLLQIDGRADLVMTLAVAVVFAPILEEFLFRGAILQGLKPQLGARAACLWSAAFFAMFHFYNPWQILPTFFLGLILGWLVLRTGSIWSAIVLHSGFNGASLWLATIEFEQLAIARWDAQWIVTAVVAALLLASLGLLMGMAWIERVTSERWIPPVEPQPVEASAPPPLGELQ